MAGADGELETAEVDNQFPIEVSGSFEAAYEHQSEFDLDDSMADVSDVAPIEAHLEIEFFPTDFFSAIFAFQLTREFELRDRGADPDRNFDPIVEHAYFLLSDPDVVLPRPDMGLSIAIGRQPFEDTRQWRYDDDLDAVQGDIRLADFFLKVSTSRKDLIDTEFLETDKEDEISNYIFDGGYALDDDTVLGVYGIRRVHREGSPDRPLFIGIYSAGMLGDHLEFWVDAGIVRGEEDERDLDGWGLDVLGTYHFDAPFSPHLTVGYAFGSGDGDPEDGTDHGFRQTGLHGNETEVNGETEFLYYGELFDPELANMSIYTLGVGAKLREGLLIDLVLHHYLQDKLSDKLRIPRSMRSRRAIASAWAVRLI